MPENRSAWEFSYAAEDVIHACREKLKLAEKSRDEMKEDYELVVNELRHLDIDPTSQNDLGVLKREHPDDAPMMIAILTTWMKLCETIRGYERWLRTLKKHGEGSLMLTDSDIEYFGL